MPRPSCKFLNSSHNPGHCGHFVAVLACRGCGRTVTLPCAPLYFVLWLRALCIVYMYETPAAGTKQI